MPSTNADARRAGTVHVVGSLAELAANERDIHAGRMPERPFVLVGQQYLADPGRSVGNVHPVWTYAHVPNGYSGDATAAIIAQIERSRRDSATASWARPPGPPPKWPRTTPITSVATS
ncbi:hypothetical protein [Mycobacterium sp.]|uniref:hypothetical protein n=1 Tax=Mycobacterium sp. TaxID=1785 RepID=UPI003C78F287